METDWEEGRPPQMLEIDAFILGQVRRGWREGSIFIPVDCTHPQQNLSIDIDLVTNWRARDSIMVIKQGGYNQFCATNTRGQGIYEGMAASALSSLFGEYIQ